MGRIGKLIQSKIETYIDHVIETRLNYNQTCRMFGPAGDDSPPLKDERIVIVQVDGTGRFVAVGALSISQGAKPGEKILYSRDENGELKAVLSLLQDGKVKLETPGDIEVKTDGQSSLEATAVKIKGETTITGNTEIKGGTLKTAGTASPTGSGPFCAIPVCPFTAAPHVGDLVNGT